MHKKSTQSSNNSRPAKTTASASKPVRNATDNTTGNKPARNPTSTGRKFGGGKSAGYYKGKKQSTSRHAVDLADFLSIIRASNAKTLQEMLQVAKMAAGPGVPITYSSKQPVDVSTSALIIVSFIPGFQSPAPLSLFRGTVIEWTPTTTKVVSFPSLALTENASITPAVNNLDDWTITAMGDDTVITLYFHDDAWKMSSARGIDVSGHNWMDTEITFRQALNECLPEDFQWETLDVDACYTVGFHHHKMHPFTAEPQSVRLLQVAIMSSGDIPTTFTCAPDTREAFYGMAKKIGIPADSPVQLADLPPNKLKSWMLLNNKHALTNYVRGVHRNDTTPIHYGYILRRNTDGDGPANISLPSSLMHIIKKSVYSFPPNLKLTAANRKHYIMARACTSTDMKYDFVRLFPQWTDEYRACENLLRETTTAIVAELSRRGVGSAEWDQPQESDKVVALAKILLPQIEKFDINPFDSLANSIVYDIISTPDNAVVLMEYLE